MLLALSGAYCDHRLRCLTPRLRRARTSDLCSWAVCNRRRTAAFVGPSDEDNLRALGIDVAVLSAI